jgi:hypothetical protein
VVRQLIDDSAFDGFSDLEHLSKKGLNVSPLRNILSSNDKIEATPIPFMFLIVRAIYQAHLLQRKRIHGYSADNLGERIRFAVFSASHMTEAVEVDIGAIRNALNGVKAREDVRSSTIRTMAQDEKKKIILTEWANLAFYHIPKDRLDPLWDLFLMDQSPFISPKRYQGIADSGYRENALAPIIVGDTRNRKTVRAIESYGHAVQHYTMGHWGAAIHLSLLLTPVTGERDEMGLLPVITDATARGRDLALGDVWVLLTYEPPTVMLDADNANIGPEGNVTIGDEENYQ